MLKSKFSHTPQTTFFEGYSLLKQLPNFGKIMKEEVAKVLE